MNAMIGIEGVTLLRAAITPGLFNQRRRDESNLAAEACSSGLGHRGLINIRIVPAWRLLLVKVRLSLVAAVVVCLSFTCRPASAQEVIHALTGTLTSVSATGKSVSIKLDDGTIRTFKEISGSNAASGVEKALQARAIPAGGLSKSGERVILFYYGVSDLCKLCGIWANASVSCWLFVDARPA